MVLCEVFRRVYIKDELNLQKLSDVNNLSAREKIKKIGADLKEKVKRLIKKHDVR